MEYEMATQSSILAGKFYGQKILVGSSSWGHKELGMTEQLSTFIHKWKLSMAIVINAAINMEVQISLWYLIFISFRYISRSRIADGFSIFHLFCGTLKWQPTPVFLPGISHGWRNLVGYSPWGRKESDTTGQLWFHFSPFATVSVVPIYIPTNSAHGFPFLYIIISACYLLPFDDSKV